MRKLGGKLEVTPQNTRASPKDTARTVTSLETAVRLQVKFAYGRASIRWQTDKRRCQMFFKKKCPNCGAKNPQGLTTCAICGSPFLLREVEKFLWNPNAIGRWSLLFSPLFGSILTFMNWRALGKDKDAKKALVWILISILALVALLFLLAQQYFGFTALGIVAFIIVWYSSLNTPQAKYFKIELNNQYIKKKWGKPLVLALGGLVGYLVCVVIAVVIAIHGLCYIRAGFWYDWGDYDRAIANFTKALEIDPRNDVAYKWRGLAWSKKGDYDRAIADFNKALEINPRLADAYNNRAWLLATCPDAKYRNGVKAVELAQKAVELDPKPLWLDTLAAAYAEAGKFEDAIATQEKAIALLKKEEGETEILVECMERLTSYKNYKPWRER